MPTPHRLFWRICVLIALFGLHILRAGAAEPKLEEHLKRVILKRVEYRELTFEEAVSTWIQSVHAQSPRKFSVRVYGCPPQPNDAGALPPQPNIPGLPPAPAAEIGKPPEITITLSEVPAIEVLKYIGDLAHYRLDLTNDGVVLSAGPVRRLDWVSKTFPMSPTAIVRAKADFAGGPLPRPPFSLEGALALSSAQPELPVSIRWNARRDAVTVEGHLESIERVEPVLKSWNVPPPKPKSPPRMTECDTKFLALYERLNALVLRDVLIGKAKVEDALAALDQLCIEASGKKAGGLGLSIAGQLAQPQGEPIHLEAKEITAWKALKEILRQGAPSAHLDLHRGRLQVSRVPRQDSFRFWPPDEDDDLVIAEFPVYGLPWKVVSNGKSSGEETAGAKPDEVHHARDFLSGSGLTLKVGRFAMYSPASHTLVCKDTPERLLQIKKLICDELAKAGIRNPMMPEEPVITDGNQPVLDKPRE